MLHLLLLLMSSYTALATSTLAGRAKARLNGVTIEHHSVNCQSPDAVLLIMGHSRTMKGWRLAAAALADAGFRVITFDNRDIGLSQRFDDANPDPSSVSAQGAATTGLCAYTLDDMAEDAIQILDHYAVDRAHVVGASMGGQVAQILAVRHASRCRSLVLMMTAASIGRATMAAAAADGGAFLAALGAATRQGPTPGMGLDEFLRYRAPYWELLSTDRAHPVLSLEARADAIAVDTADFERGAVDWHGAGAARQTLAVTEWERSRADAHVAALAGLAVPTLVLHGTHDPLIAVQAGRDLAATVPTARLVEYDGGHNFGNHPAVTARLWEAMVEHLRAH